MKISIDVENIRCDGCANTITKKIMALEGVESVDIAIEDQIVTIEAKDDTGYQSYVKALLAMGYPEKGSVEGIAALKSKAKSVVSCAIGKVS
ncbi:MAG: heavy metal transporter [Methylophaga sp.]|nr:MAG: heavy metal transporter [Methylophaga sp.]